LARTLRNQLAFNQSNLMQNFESTYALLVRSEEKKRNVLEIVVYALFILSAAFSIWQFAHQSVAFPLDRVTNASAGVIETRPS
jgi:hypothetical protein